MKLDYFTLEEDRKFSDIVISYNAMKEAGKDDKKLYEFIKDRTNLLLYLIPIRNLFLEHDEAADIYVSLYEKIDGIIHSYRVSNSTYNNYLAHICRYRAMSNTAKRNREYLTLLDSSYHDFINSPQGCEDIMLAENSMHYGIDRPEALLLDLESLIEFIAENRDGSTEELSATELELHDELESTAKRRMLLVYLLYLPSSPSPMVISEIAKVLELDSLILARFFELKHNLLSERLQKKEENYLKGIKHWKIMLSLMRAIELEADRKAKESLEEKYEKISKCHKQRMKAASESKGLTQEEISLIVNESRATVYKSIAEMRNLLRIIAKADVALDDT